MLGGLGHDAPVAQYHFNKAKESFEELSRDEQNGQDEETEIYGIMIDEALEALKPEMRAWKIEHDIDVSSSEAGRSEGDDDAGNPSPGGSSRREINSAGEDTNRGQQPNHIEDTNERSANEEI